jgi:ferredoxin
MVEYICYVLCVREGLLCGGCAALPRSMRLMRCLRACTTCALTVFIMHSGSRVLLFCSFTAVGVCYVHKLKSKKAKDRFYIF